MHEFIKTYNEIVLLIDEPSEISVLSFIINRIDAYKTNKVFITTEDISKATKVSERTVQRALKGLQEKKYIEISRESKRYIQVISEEVAEIAGIDLTKNQITQDKSKYYEKYTELLHKDTAPTTEDLKSIGCNLSRIRAYMMYLIVRDLQKYHDKYLIIDGRTQKAVDMLFGTDKHSLTDFIKDNKIRIENGIKNTNVANLDNWNLIIEISHRISNADNSEIQVSSSVHPVEHILDKTMVKN